jgi:hypothetical protein
MSKFRYNISLIIVLVSLFSVQAFSQQQDSLAVNNSQKVNLKPGLHYSLGSTFTFVPHLGSVTGVTITPVLTIPLSPRLSVDGGIIAGRYYSSFGNNHEVGINGEFNSISIFGSATYHVNPQLTLYGAGIKQVTGNSPFNMLPKSSYVLGSNYNFGSFSVGVSVQMSKWNNNLSPLPFNDSQGFYSPFEQRTSTYMPFGR